VSTVLFLLLPVQLLAIVAGIWWASTLDRPASAPRPPVVSTTAVAAERVRVTVRVQLRTAPGPQLVAPGWSGIVTSVALAPGTVIEGGAPALAVDGIERRVCVAAFPLYRPLVPGDAGPDVAVADACLTQAGFPGSRALTGVADDELATRVAALAEVLGAPPGGALEPSWFVWTPTPGWQVASLAAEIGAPAPPAGAPVAIAAASVTDAVGDPDDLRRVAAMAALAPAVLVRASGDDRAVRWDGDLAAAVRALHALGAIEVVDAAFDVVATDLTLELEALLDPADGWVVVPASSVLPADPPCAIVGGDASWSPVVLDEVRDVAGLTYVRGLVAGEEVVVNPQAAGEIGCS